MKELWVCVRVRVVVVFAHDSVKNCKTWKIDSNSAWRRRPGQDVIINQQRRRLGISRHVYLSPDCVLRTSGEITTSNELWQGAAGRGWRDVLRYALLNVMTINHRDIWLQDKYNLALCCTCICININYANRIWKGVNHPKFGNKSMWLDYSRSTPLKCRHKSEEHVVPWIVSFSTAKCVQLSLDRVCTARTEYIGNLLVLCRRRILGEFNCRAKLKST